ncbi:MAG TPA: branched-chain amino acid ABC transporter substrate-binding protein [Ramlibacter sp.]|nr:branched-chain amino acid ABC transporter substrate-binding protein [Ramlibacter sp.]
MIYAMRHVTLAAVLALAGPALAQQAAPAAKPATAAPAKAAAGPLAGQTVRVAFIDPLSGPFGNVGQSILKHWQFMAERFAADKNPAGVKFEFVGFDGKGLPQDSLNALKAATDQGFRYITQGNGSGVAGALVDAINKHNERNPGKELIFINYAAVDPSLTNEKCSYWHFRLDADTSMKMEALTSFMKDEAKIKKVYLINQNYAHGHQVASFFKDGIKRKRPDVQIVGEDLHPIGQVKDFAPYVAKIKASGADAVVTGNWGTDMTLLVKAFNDAGMTLPIYAYYASVSGTPTALAQSKGIDVSQVGIAHSNHGGEYGAIRKEFKAKFNEDFYVPQTYYGVQLLSQAMANAKSSDPVKVAAALEGLSVKGGVGGEITVRKSDHQLQQHLYIAKWTKVAPGTYNSEENTGFNFHGVKTLEPYVSSTPTSCQMQRPSAGRS